MSKPKILHMITPAQNMSPFDVNMAADAGYQIIVPHCQVPVSNVFGLVQDAIFSRPPKSAASTGMFIGGYDVNQAVDMLEAARKAMVPPFELSLFADPNGAFTTSAALIAVIEKCLLEHTGHGLEGRRVKIFGGGPVGLCAFILAAQRGAIPSLVRLTASAQPDAATEFTQRYGMEISSEQAVDTKQRMDAVFDVEVVICTAKAGIQVLDKSTLEHAEKLLLAADVNAVPPAGIEGVGVMDNGAEIQTKRGSYRSIGALGIGRVKYQVQNQLFKRMLSSEDAVTIDFPDAYAEAAKIVG